MREESLGRRRAASRTKNKVILHIHISTFVVVLTLTRIIKSVVTGQAAVTLELRNTPGKNTNKPKVVHAYIIADAIHASARKIYKSEIGSQPAMWQYASVVRSSL